MIISLVYSSMIVMLNCMSDKIFNFYTKTFEIMIVKKQLTQRLKHYWKFLAPNSVRFEILRCTDVYTQGMWVM